MKVKSESDIHYQHHSNVLSVDVEANSYFWYSTGEMWCLPGDVSPWHTVRQVRTVCIL